MSRRTSSAIPFSLLLLCLSLALAPGATAAAPDDSLPAGPGSDEWPQFRGAERDGISPVRGLARSWPADGPRELWRRPVGQGFTTAVVAGGKLYVGFLDGEQEVLAALDPDSGEELWRHPLGPKFEEQFGNGPRSTPVVVGDTVYAIGSTGRLHAVATVDGSPRWQHDLTEEFGSRMPLRGYCSSPLVDGDLLLLDLGTGAGESGGEGEEGEEAARPSGGYAAFDRHTGELRWTALAGRIGYTSPIAIEIDGARQYVFVPSAASEIVALTADGEVAWTHEWTAGTIASPVSVPPDGVFVSASGDIGALLIRVARQGDGFTTEEVWRDRVMKNHFSTSVYYQGHVYGFDNGTLKAIEAETGEVAWAKRGLGKGSLIVADGMLILLSDQGDLVLAEATPEGFTELGRARALTGRSWTAPALAGSRLYLRNLEEMVCFDLAEGATAEGDEDAR